MSEANTHSNAQRLLWAGFMAILAAGVGFAIRGGIMGQWQSEFGFNYTQIGKLNGAGFTGFCFGIIIGGVVADKIGYGKLVFAAFLCHVLSALVTFGATKGMDGGLAFNLLYWGTFLFAIANGLLEAVANPLIATIFPKDRTHYLNILHASWPAGLILGGVAGAILGERLEWHWKMQLGLFLVPTIIYGLMFLGQKMPKSEASEKGLSLGSMLKDVGIMGGLVACYFLSLFVADVLKPLAFFNEAPHYADYAGYGVGAAFLAGIAIITKFSLGHWMIFVLFVTHAMVGAVELGTDLWIQNITGNILDNETGKWLFVYTSAVMFLLRFCAHFIEKKLGFSPIALLLTCSVIACIGLNLVSLAQTTIMVILALFVYGVGKTFFWPTMLAVVSDRFPRTGAIAISIMGGLAMMSAGLIGAPGLGYFKERYTAEELQKNEAVYKKVKAEHPSKFLVFPEVHGVDGKKLGEVKERVQAAKKDTTSGTHFEKLSSDDQAIAKADLQGDRGTLRADSAIPATMAVIYLLLLIYFKAIGGYKPVHIGEGAEGQ
ncbi:MAG: Major Facilitator Superfamily protein [Planctomycetaceae bacterium]|nr:Major Facilitator Superfamily protein [Planctomycetaceae bacterium]